MAALETMILARSPKDTVRSSESCIAYKVGLIKFGMLSDGHVRLTLDPALRDFATVPRNCDVNITVSLVDKLPIFSRKPVFDSGGLWSLFEETRGLRNGYRINFVRPFTGETPYKSAWFDHTFESGEILLSRLFFAEDRPTYPLEYPLDEVLMIHRLACGQGLEVHGVGIADEGGRGHLFLGHSGAGKSTTARLWTQHPGMRVLSDDRIILRRQEGQIRMFGTPWHGDAGISSPTSATVTNIYFLEQFQRNEIVALPCGQAAAGIFARSFVPRHSTEALDFSLSFIDQITREIPCKIFRFVPQQTAVETIRRAEN